jgi:hypothetical protein
MSSGKVNDFSNYAIDTLTLILRDHTDTTLLNKATSVMGKLQRVRDNHGISDTKFTLKLIVCFDLLL